jgi:hypothetical protein
VKIVDDNQLASELEAYLRGIDFFSLYPSKVELQKVLASSATNIQKIRAILYDDTVQWELFPDYEQWKTTNEDAVDHYISIRIAAK